MKTNHCRICLKTVAQRGPGRPKTHHPECLAALRVLRDQMKASKPKKKSRPEYMPPVTQPAACFWCASTHATLAEQHACHDRAHRAQQDVRGHFG